MSKAQEPDDDIADFLGKAANGEVDKSAFRKFVRTLRRSLRFSRKGVRVSGAGLADIMLKTAPRIPIRNAETLSTQYGGMTGSALAGQLIRHAGRNSAAIGAMTGALAAAGELAPPFWIMLPAEVVGETLLIAAIEMKLVAELHEVYGRSIQGSTTQRGMAIVEAWSQQRGVHVDELATDGGVSQALGRGTRTQVIQMVRRKLMARAARNVSSLAPLLVGAAAGAEINRRATRNLGDSVVRDLAAIK